MWPTTTPGAVVRFTTTFTNTGQTPYTGISDRLPTSPTCSMTPARNGDQTATSGTLSLTSTGVGLDRETSRSAAPSPSPAPSP